MMSMLFIRKMIIPVWSGAMLGLFALFGLPLTPSSGLLLVCTALAPPALVLFLSRKPSLTLAESIAKVLHPVDRSGTE